jgi:hypothetical protein
VRGRHHQGVILARRHGTFSPAQSELVFVSLESRHEQEKSHHVSFPCETNASRRLNFIKSESEPNLGAD